MRVTMHYYILFSVFGDFSGFGDVILAYCRVAVTAAAMTAAL